MPVVTSDASAAQDAGGIDERFAALGAAEKQGRIPPNAPSAWTPGTAEARALPAGAAGTREPLLLERRISIGPGLPEDATRRAIRGRFGALRVCYEALLDEHPDESGTMSARATVDATGGINDVDIVLAPVGFGDDPFRACARRALAALEFATSDRRDGRYFVWEVGFSGGKARRGQ
jgi:hypothetical protein